MSILLVVVFLLKTVLCPHFICSMDAWSIDKHSSLKKSYDVQKEEGQQLLYNNLVKDLYDNSDEKQEEISGSTIFPLEISDAIVKSYFGLHASEGEASLFYFSTAQGIALDETQREIRRKLALCHVIHTISEMNKIYSTEKSKMQQPIGQKMERSTPQEQIKKLRIKIPKAILEENFWADIPHYSLWQDTKMNFSVDEDLKMYIANTEKYIMLLNEACEEFSDYLLHCSSKKNYKRNLASLRTNMRGIKI